MIANRMLIGAWEQLTVVNHPNGTVSLRAYASGRYVTATSGSPLIASGTSITATEKFHVIY